MKRKIRYRYKEQTVEKEVAYIPLRYIVALLIALAEVVAILGIVMALCYKSWFLYAIAVLVQSACVIKIIASDDNPDYKVPWLLFVLIVPIVGFMMYFLFYSRSLKKKYIKRMKDIKGRGYKTCDNPLHQALKDENPVAASQAKMLCNIAETALFTNTKQTYFPLGEEMHKSLLTDLQNAEKFIYMEYYIIDEGVFWHSVLDILKEKAAKGVEVKLIYDDIGCMNTLSGNYFKVLRSYGIQATVFSLLRGGASNEFNNRSHRKITVIDGKIAYTGGINIADEYINVKQPLGHFKDNAIRLEGNAVWELTKLFLVDYGMNVLKIPEFHNDLYPETNISQQGYIVPFGDGPRPIYNRCVGKTAIQNMINSANNYVYITTPYLVMDNDLCLTVENAALRGVDVRIILPTVSDSRVISGMGRSFYKRLMDAGVRIFEYTPGFIHSKSYLTDGEYAIIGTMNLDYRSLVHNFENGVWMYKCSAIRDLENDILATLEQCEEIKPQMLEVGVFKKLIRGIVRIFAPML